MVAAVLVSGKDSMRRFIKLCYSRSITWLYGAVVRCLTDTFCFRGPTRVTISMTADQEN